MKEYHKIQTLFKRDMTIKGNPIVLGDWTLPEFEYLQHAKWVGTEKVDGTNIRVLWQDGELSFKGKSDQAEMFPGMLDKLQGMFTSDKMFSVFSDANVCLYGEGFGAGIQACGKKYTQGKNFILFDVRIGDFWLKMEDVSDIANKLNILAVPVLFSGTLHEAISLVAEGFKSTISEDKDLMCEGLILQPKVPLLARNRERIIAKIKHRDFAFITQTNLTLK